MFININWSNKFGAVKNKTVKIVKFDTTTSVSSRVPPESLHVCEPNLHIQDPERIMIRTSLAHSPSQQCVIDKCVLKTNTAGGGIENIWKWTSTFPSLVFKYLEDNLKGTMNVKDLYLHQTNKRETPEEKRHKLAFISPPRIMPLATETLGNFPAAMVHLYRRPRSTSYGLSLQADFSHQVWGAFASCCSRVCEVGEWRSAWQIGLVKRIPADAAEGLSEFH